MYYEELDEKTARYWPEPGNKEALQILFEPFCHHVIRRINKTIEANREVLNGNS